MCFPVDEEIIRAEPDAPAHRDHLGCGRIVVWLFDEAAFVKALENVRMVIEGADRLFHGGLPIVMREIGPERDASAAPAELGEATDLQDQIALFLAEARKLAPILN